MGKRIVALFYLYADILETHLFDDRNTAVEACNLWERKGKGCKWVMMMGEEHASGELPDSVANATYQQPLFE